MAELVFVRRKMKDDLRYNKDQDKWISIGEVPDNDKFGNAQYEAAEYGGVDVGVGGPPGAPCQPFKVIREGSRCLIRGVPDKKETLAQLRSHGWHPSHQSNIGKMPTTEQLVEVNAQQAFAAKAKEQRKEA